MAEQQKNNNEEEFEEILNLSEDEIDTFGYDDSVEKTNVLDRRVISNSDLVGGTSFHFGAEDKVLKFKPDTGIWLGGASFSSAPFRVDMDGNLVANSATITGTITADSGSDVDWSYINNVEIDNADIEDGAITNAKIANATIEYGKIASLNAGDIITGTLNADDIGFSGTITGPSFRTDTSGNDRLVITNNEWSDSHALTWYDSSDNQKSYITCFSGTSVGGTLFISADDTISLLQDSTVSGKLQVGGPVYADEDNAYSLGSSTYGYTILYLTDAADSGIRTGTTDRLIFNNSDNISCQNLLPNEDRTFTLGDSTYEWENVYTGKISLAGTEYIDFTGGLIQLKDVVDLDDNQIQKVGGILPYNSSQDLGSSSYPWDNVYCADIYNPSGDNVMNFDGGDVNVFRPFGFEVRSGTPGSASSYEGYMYYDTNQVDLVFSNGSDWYKVEATKI